MPTSTSTRRGRGRDAHESPHTPRARRCAGAARHRRRRIGVRAATGSVPADFRQIRDLPGRRDRSGLWACRPYWHDRPCDPRVSPTTTARLSKVVPRHRGAAGSHWTAQDLDDPAWLASTSAPDLCLREARGRRRRLRLLKLDRPEDPPPGVPVETASWVRRACRGRRRRPMVRLRPQDPGHGGGRSPHAALSAKATGRRPAWRTGIRRRRWRAGGDRGLTRASTQSQRWAIRSAPGLYRLGGGCSVEDQHANWDTAVHRSFVSSTPRVAVEMKRACRRPGRADLRSCMRTQWLLSPSNGELDLMVLKVKRERADGTG